MKLPLGYPFKLVVVFWRDAVCHGADDKTISELETTPPGRVCVCVGWLVRETAEVLSVAAEYEAQNPVVLRGVWDIPRAMAVEVRDITPKRRRAKAKP